MAWVSCSSPWLIRRSTGLPGSRNPDHRSKAFTPTARSAEFRSQGFPTSSQTTWMATYLRCSQSLMSVAALGIGSIERVIDRGQSTLSPAPECSAGPPDHFEVVHNAVALPSNPDHPALQTSARDAADGSTYFFAKTGLIWTTSCRSNSSCGVTATSARSKWVLARRATDRRPLRDRATADRTGSVHRNHPYRRARSIDEAEQCGTLDPSVRSKCASARRDCDRPNSRT